MTVHVLYHADSDGRFGGYCAWRSFKDRNAFEDAKFIEVQYGQPFPLDIEKLTTEDQVFIIDFSYDRATLDQVYLKVGFLKVLDHHETAEEQLRGAPYAFFDGTKSGALLAWEYFFPKQEPSVPCKLVNDFDMWHWKYENTGPFETWLRYDRVGSDWQKWDKLNRDEIHLKECLSKGMLLDQYNKSIMEAFASNPENVTTGVFYPPEWSAGVSFAIFNGMGILHSQLSEVVYKKYNVDISLNYRIRNDIVTFSVRAPNPEKAAAHTFAKYFGGGGRPATAGFRLSLREGLNLISQLTAGESLISLLSA